MSKRRFIGRSRRPRRLWAALLLATLLPMLAQAQSAFDTPSAYYEDALAREADDDLAGALIQLKNALQLDDGHTPSMLLLGEMLLENEAPGQAAVVLSEALLLGADPRRTTPLLAEAYLRANNYAALLNRLPYDEAPRGLRPELLAANAQAYLGLGRSSEAAALLKQAQALDPNNQRLQLAFISLYLRRMQVGEALAIATRLIAAHPEDTRAWNAYASVQQMMGQSADAIAAYQRTIALRPNNVDARLSLIAMLIQLGRIDEVGEDLAFLLENFPDEPRASYFEALLAASRGDTERERAALTETANGIDRLDPARVDGNLQLLMFGALAHSSLGAPETSLDYLERYLQLNAEDPGALRLQAQTLLALDERNKALQVLLKLNARYPDDRRTKSLLAAAYAADGEHLRATEILASLANEPDSDPARARQLGISQINAGLVDDGIATLEAAARAQPATNAASLPLATAYMRTARWDEAEAVLRAMLTRAPDDLNLRSLLSLTLLSSGETEAAEDLMRQMLSEAPEFLPPWINLAKRATAQGDLDAAKKLLDEAATHHPDNPRIFYERGLIASAENQLDEAIRHFERALQLEPNELMYAKPLVVAYLRSGMRLEAENLAENASISRSDPFTGARLYGETLVALGKPKQAALVYTQMARAADFDTRRLLVIAGLQSQIAQHESAINTLSMALTANPKLIPARQRVIREQLLASNPAAAAKLCLAYQSDFPEDTYGYLLAGESALALGDTRAADAAYRDAQSRGAAVDATLGLYRVLRAEARPAEAEALIREALAQEALVQQTPTDATQAPGDPRLQIAYADVLMAQQKWRDAEGALSLLISQQADVWVHWNNRAYVRQRLESAGAEPDAREAYRLSPDSASTNDTLGWILMDSNQPGEALPYLRQAIARSSDNPAMRYHLGAVLAALGRRQEAEKELFYALEDESDWTDRDAAAELLARLQQKVSRR